MLGDLHASQQINQAMQCSVVPARTPRKLQVAPALLLPLLLLPLLLLLLQLRARPMVQASRAVKRLPIVFSDGLRSVAGLWGSGAARSAACSTAGGGCMNNLLLSILTRQPFCTESSSSPASTWYDILLTSPMRRPDAGDVENMQMAVHTMARRGASR